MSIWYTIILPLGTFGIIFLYFIFGSFCFDDFDDDSRTSSTGKTYIDREGYRRFTSSDYPVHRWVAEKTLGRKLTNREVVHHLNRRRADNREENLVVMDEDDHDMLHEENLDEDDFDVIYL